MQDFASKKGQDRGPVTLTDPIELVGDLLDDLNEGTRGSRSITVVERDEVRRIDTTQLATMSITFEVI